MPPHISSFKVSADNITSVAAIHFLPTENI